MQKDQKFNLKLGNKDLEVTLNNLAEQASGSCFVKYGDTLVLATATMSKYENENLDYFPLTVEYEEKYYAAGKIFGSRFIRRETRPSDEAVLTARAIDRTLRPQFPKGFSKEVQVVVTCLSWDRENDPDVPGIIAASLALSLSNIPFNGPLAALRVAKKDNEFILNPTYEQRSKCDFEILFSGIEKNKDFLINMVETESRESGEEDLFKAFKFAKENLLELIQFEKKIKEQFGKEKEPVPILSFPDVEKETKSFLQNRLENALFQKDKKERYEGLSGLLDELSSHIEETFGDKEKTKYARNLFEEESEKILKENAIYKDRRPDGRKWDEIREIDFRVGMLPRTHGSGLFERGQTKSLSILTLGAPSDVRLLQGMEIVGEKRFMHHYNFPPYSTGETKPMRGPGRREIGHGMLAEKALLPVIPESSKFPYTMRVVTEILSSNGSSSMASVTSSSLALMDAGVPIKTPATGISIGLMQNEKGDYKLIADIQGPEDHHGDMDFKIAGTKNGITAIQMDTKIDGINENIFKESLDLAKKVRLRILDKMQKVLKEPRPELSPFAPRILSLKIDPDKIREVIGPGGKMINKIIDECGVNIDIEDTGEVLITAEKEEAGKKALDWIRDITREATVGETFTGTVKRIFPFGAMVEILPNQEGLIHISKLSSHRVNRVEDVVNIGDKVSVKVIQIDEQGRINLSLEQVKK